MQTNDAREQVREAIEGYLIARGINTRGRFHCLHPDHDDKHPSMSFDKSRNKVHCFACGADLDMFDLIGLEYGLREGRDIFRKAYEVFGIAPGGAKAAGKKPARAEKTAAPEDLPGHDYTAYYRQCAEQLPGSPAQEYLAARGISLETAQRFLVGYDPAWRSPKALREGKNPPASRRVVIPTGVSSYVARAVDDAVEKKFAKMKEGKARPMNLKALAGSAPVFVVEGELDMLSLAEVGQEAVALGSASAVDALLTRLSEQRPGGLLLLALDDDAAGQAAQERLAQGLTEQDIAFARADILLGHNDPNDALMAGRDAFAQAVEQAAQGQSDQIEAYLKNSAASHIPAFLGAIADSVNSQAVPTGFAGVDRVLDGGLYEGLYILGAITSLGKTSFALQMADQIAMGGQDVLIFSLEMARHELMAKSISRHTFQTCNELRLSSSLAKTARGILAGKRHEGYSIEEKALITDAVGAYQQYAGRVFISEGIGDLGVAQVRSAVMRHVTLMGRRPVVLVDYLQILAPYSEHATDKQNTDKAVLELKRISRDFKIPVVGISSFNRAGYGTKVQMESFKESGAIEYSSDVLLGLQCAGAGQNGFDADAEKKKNPRDIEMVVLKNRNGPVGDSVPFQYYQMFNCFLEE